jgi:phosphoesterase RecJ-like protein
MIAAEAAELMRGAGSVLVVSHKNPDGDAIGTQLALGQILESHAEKVTLLASDPLPPRYAWLPGTEKIAVATSCEERFPLVVALECGNLERTGISGISGEVVVNIDHHQQNDHYGRLNWVDPGFSSVGEMIYHVARQLSGAHQIPLDAAVNLYTAILTDTGSFRFSNTSPDALAICGKLVALGVQPAEVAAKIYQNHSAARLRLMGRVLSTLEIDSDGRIGWVVVSQADLRETGAAPEDVEGLVNLPMSIGQLEAAALFREQPDGTFRVSLRSKRIADVAKVAAAFGGGGHLRAAGLTFTGTLPAAVAAVTGALADALRNALAGGGRE